MKACLPCTHESLNIEPFHIRSTPKTLNSFPQLIKSIHCQERKKTFNISSLSSCFSDVTLLV